MIGAFSVNIPITVIATIGLVTGAIYSLVAMQRVFQGPANPDRHLKDFGGKELAAMVPLMLGLIWLGVYPQPVLDLVEPVLTSLNNLTNIGITDVSIKVYSGSDD